jgi:hypothetical protein
VFSEPKQRLWQTLPQSTERLRVISNPLVELSFK